MNTREAKRKSDDWDKTPARNPYYRGQTPEQVVKRVMRPLSKSEIKDLKSKSRKKS